MKIRELSVSNCLSYDESGLNRSNSVSFGEFNLLIGTNNSGKSNMLRVVELVRHILLSLHNANTPALRDVPVAAVGNFSNFVDWVFAREKGRNISFALSLEIEQADGERLNVQPYRREDAGNPVFFMFGLSDTWPKLFRLVGCILFVGNDPRISITRAEIPNNHEAYRDKPILFDRGSKLVLALRPEFQGSDEQVWKVVGFRDENAWAGDYQRVGSALNNFIREIYERVFKELLVPILATRRIELSGDEIVESLSNLRDGDPQERELEKRITRHVQSLIFPEGGQEVALVYPPSEGGKRQVKIQVGELQLPLSLYGSSVEQMLILAAEIVRHGSNKIILMEEPEAHLFPHLQREFIRFLRESQTLLGHQYLIASHSSIFIDELMHMGGNVFYVHRVGADGNKPKSSHIQPFDKGSSATLFKELGIKPSDLLLANGVLIVEGPIDKDVYVDWARKIGKPFEQVGLELLDVDGAGNISKYLCSSVIQRTCFTNFGLCDKNAEAGIRKKLAGIVPDQNLIVLQKGDIEDYYAREVVLEFAKEWGKIKGKREEEIPDTIEAGRTVEKLNELLGGDWWKRKLSQKIMEEMSSSDIEDEIKDAFARIYARHK